MKVQRFYIALVLCAGLSSSATAQTGFDNIGKPSAGNDIQITNADRTGKMIFSIGSEKRMIFSPLMNGYGAIALFPPADYTPKTATLQIGDRSAIYFGHQFVLGHNTYWNGTGNSRFNNNDGGGALVFNRLGEMYLRTFAPGSDDNWKATNVISMDATGHVAIGNYIPQNPETNEKYKLWVDGTVGVNGSIKAQEVEVVTNVWPDYVFKKGYILAPLSEVEQHIAETGHLPGIPSEAEVKKNGVNLGEMQVKLLEKIEEMTLRMIEQEKRLQALEEENKKLRETNK
ncbi:MAG: hypothetical protein V4642_06255 [Bacteroidota bacterium]